MKNSITPPSEDDIKKDYDALYRPLSQKKVASSAGVSESRFSKQRSFEAIEMRNPLYEVKMEMYASKVTEQEQIGKWIVKEILDYGVELGLINEKPLDIVRMARDRLSTISADDVRQMDPEASTEMITAIAEVEYVTGELSQTLCQTRCRPHLMTAGKSRA